MSLSAFSLPLIPACTFTLTNSRFISFFWIQSLIALSQFSLLNFSSFRAELYTIFWLIKFIVFLLSVRILTLVLYGTASSAVAIAPNSALVDDGQSIIAS